MGQTLTGLNSAVGPNHGYPWLTLRIFAHGVRSLQMFKVEPVRSSLHSKTVEPYEVVYSFSITLLSVSLFHHLRASDIT